MQSSTDAVKHHKIPNPVIHLSDVLIWLRETQDLVKKKKKRDPQISDNWALYLLEYLLILCLRIVVMEAVGIYKNGKILLRNLELQ